MSYRNACSFGKRIEYKVIGAMLKSECDVYIPIVDDHGVDCVVKKKDGTFLEIQIKARASDVKQCGFFTVDNHEDSINNFYFVFYSERVDTYWVFTSSDFIKNSQLNIRGKNKGRRKIRLVTDGGKIREEFQEFICNDFGVFN